MAHKTEIEVNGVIIEVTEFDHTAQEIDDAVDKINEGGDDNAVLFTAQTLTTGQQAQARTNIGAVSTADFTAALGEVSAALADMDEVIE